MLQFWLVIVKLKTNSVNAYQIIESWYLNCKQFFQSIDIKQDIAIAIFSKLKVILILKEKIQNIDIDIASGFW